MYILHWLDSDCLVDSTFILFYLFLVVAVVFFLEPISIIKLCRWTPVVLLASILICSIENGMERFTSDLYKVYRHSKWYTHINSIRYIYIYYENGFIRWQLLLTPALPNTQTNHTRQHFAQLCITRYPYTVRFNSLLLFIHNINHSSKMIYSVICETLWHRSRFSTHVSIYVYIIKSMES